MYRNVIDIRFLYFQLDLRNGRILYLMRNDRTNWILEIITDRILGLIGFDNS